MAILRNRRGAALALLCAAQTMILTDTSIVNVALPAIESAMGASTMELQWIVTAYTLLFGGFMLLGGRAGDLWGMRNLLIVGMGVFTLASVLGGFAASTEVLIAARALQGLGAALSAPSIISLVSVMYEDDRERSRALSVVGAVNAIGFSLGLILGGVLTDSLGWQAVFFVNVPVGVAFIALAPGLLPRNERLRQPLDVPGAATATVGLSLFVLALSLAETYGLLSWPILGLLVVAALALAVFVAVEKRSAHPLVPLRFFRNRTALGANLATVVFGAIITPMFFFLTLYLQNALGLGSLLTGFAFLPHSLVVLFAAGATEKLVRRYGARAVLIGGMLAFAAGFALLTRIGADGGYWTAVLPGTLLVGFGVATIIVAAVIAATAGAAPQEQGLASGVWNTAIPVGSAIGMAILTLVAQLRASGLADGGLDPSLAYVEGFRTAFFASFVFLALGFLAVTLLMKRTRPEALPLPAAAAANRSEGG